jgi:hypothetical protein
MSLMVVAGCVIFGVTVAVLPLSPEDARVAGTFAEGTVTIAPGRLVADCTNPTTTTVWITDAS